MTPMWMNSKPSRPPTPRSLRHYELRLWLVLTVLSCALFAMACRGGGPSTETASATASRGATATAATAAPISRASSNDPFEYCAAVGTIEKPDARYAGPAISQSILQGLAAAEKLPNRFVPPGSGVAVPWRCANGRLLACDPGANLPCGQADTSREPTQAMRDWCQQHPGGAPPAVVTGHATIFRWSCQADTPFIERQVFDVDEQGFVANFWYVIQRP